MKSNSNARAPQTESKGDDSIELRPQEVPLKSGESRFKFDPQAKQFFATKRRKLTGHTPGPWKLFGAEMDNARYWVGTREGRYIASVGMIDSNDHSDAANARLIVAAPKMLVVLKQLFRDLRDAKANCLNRHPHSAWVRIEEDWNAIIERTEEMIRETERQ